jgi:hypothetical protein
MSEASSTTNGDPPPSGDPWEFPRLKRELLYALAWLPPLVVMVWWTDAFGPIFAKLDEKEQLPKLSLWLWTFARFSDEYFQLPSVFVYVMLRTLAEYFIIVSRRVRCRELCCHVWCCGVSCSGIFLWAVGLTASLSPVFKMSSAVISGTND